MKSILDFLRSQWFLTTVLVVIGLGVFRPNWAVELAEACHRFLPSSFLTAFVLFLMSVTLPLKKFHESLKRPWGLLLASLISIVIMPLLGWGLSRVQLTVDAQWGLLIAGAVPSTMASSAVWTRRASGNDAISLCVTMITNGSCFLVIPFWMRIYSGEDLGFDPWGMIQKLLLVAVLPMTLGQILRAIPSIGDWVVQARNKQKLSILSQIGILLIIYQGLIHMSVQNLPHGTNQSINTLSLIWLGLCCLLLHAMGLGLGIFLSRHFELNPADQIAVGISGSQKTLAIALETATFPQIIAFAGGGLLMLGPLMFHLLQLIFDSVVVEVWNRQQNKT